MEDVTEGTPGWAIARTAEYSIALAHSREHFGTEHALPAPATQMRRETVAAGYPSRGGVPSEWRGKI